MSMAEEVGFEVEPGVELHAALRGPRLSLGPAIQRLDRAGRTGQEPADERWPRWAAAAGGGRLPERRRRRRRWPWQRKQDEWQTIHDHLVRVTTAHERPVTRAMPPELGEDRRDEQAAADDWWQALVANDPATVAARLRLAFEQHRFAAAVTAVEGERVHLVVPVAKAAALVGDREPTTEPRGGRTLPKMTKERRHEMYELAIGSGLMATFAEVLAVCPGVESVVTGVVAPEYIGGPAVLLLTRVSRGLVLPGDADRARVGELRDIERAQGSDRGRLVIDRGPTSGAMRGLDRDHPEVAAILEVLEVS